MMDKPFFNQLRYWYLTIMSKRKAARNVGGVFKFRPLHALIIVAIGTWALLRYDASETQAALLNWALALLVLLLIVRWVWRLVKPHLKNLFIKAPNLYKDPERTEFDRVDRRR